MPVGRPDDQEPFQDPVRQAPPDRDLVGEQPQVWECKGAFGHGLRGDHIRLAVMRGRPMQHPLGDDGTRKRILVIERQPPTPEHPEELRLPGGRHPDMGGDELLRQRQGCVVRQDHRVPRLPGCLGHLTGKPVNDRLELLQGDQRGYLVGTHPGRLGAQLVVKLAGGEKPPGKPGRGFRKVVTRGKRDDRVAVLAWRRRSRWLARRGTVARGGVLIGNHVPGKVGGSAQGQRP